MDYGRPELADRLGAAYVVGTLRGGARRRVEALLPAHPALRHAVAAWQDRLMPLTLALAPKAPPASVWKRIEARLDGGPRQPAAASPARGGWSSLAFWRGLGGAASVLALTLGVLLASPGPAQAPTIIVLAPATPAPSGTAPAADGSLAASSIVASLSADGRALVTRPVVGVNLRADRALELWSVPASGAPRSLGLISSRDATVVRRSPLPAGTAALAVSLEPAGGSPSGAPTGPVLYVGKLGG